MHQMKIIMNYLQKNCQNVTYEFTHPTLHSHCYETGALLKWHLRNNLNQSVFTFHQIHVIRNLLLCQCYTQAKLSEAHLLPDM